MSVGRIEIRRLTTLPTEIRALVDAGTAEGFSFAARLVQDWESGQNCFHDAPQTFTEVRLRTKDAGSFYERLGFRLSESDTATHVLDMRRSGTDVSPDA